MNYNFPSEFDQQSDKSIGYSFMPKFIIFGIKE